MVRPVGNGSVVEPQSRYDANAFSNPLASIARKLALYASPMFLLLATLPAAEGGPFTYMVCYGICMAITKSSGICNAQCMKHMTENSF